MEQALPLSGTDTGDRGLLLLLAKAVRSWVGTRALTDEERRLKSVMEDIAASIGPRLLQADSLEDFHARLDALVESKEVSAHLRRLDEAVAPLGSTTARLGAESQESFDALVDVLGEGQASLVREAHRLVCALMEALDNLLRILRLVLNADVSQLIRKEEEDPLAFMTDREVPPKIASALLGARYATTCLIAIVSASLLGKKLEPWLARAIAEKWVAGLRRHLLLVASFPGTNVPTDIVPLHERLDLEALERENAATNAAMDAFHEAARRSDADVYAPDDSEAGR